jgi:hypothetical protein
MKMNTLVPYLCAAGAPFGTLHSTNSRRCPALAQPQVGNFLALFRVIGFQAGLNLGYRVCFD